MSPVSAVPSRVPCARRGCCRARAASSGRRSTCASRASALLRGEAVSTASTRPETSALRSGPVRSRPLGWSMQSSPRWQQGLWQTLARAVPRRMLPGGLLRCGGTEDGVLDPAEDAHRVLPLNCSALPLLSANRAGTERSNDAGPISAFRWPLTARRRHPGPEQRPDGTATTSLRFCPLCGFRLSCGCSSACPPSGATRHAAMMEARRCPRTSFKTNRWTWCRARRHWTPQAWRVRMGSHRRSAT